MTLPQEAGLADVMDLAATGGLVKGVRIEGFTDDTTPAEVYELTLADVQVIKVADGEGDGFTLSLDYSKIALITNGIDATGQPTSNGAFAYDVANKIEIDPFSLDLSPSGNQAPVANALSISTDEDTATAVMLSGSDVDGDSLSFTVVSGPAHGTLSGSGANLAYTPASNYNGPDSFTYVANDGALDSAVASVSLTVNPVNDNAIITGTTTGDVTEAGGVNNGTAGVPTASGNLDSTDVDNPPADTWQVVAAGTASIGLFGTYAVAPDGTWTYTLDDSDLAVQALNGVATLTDTFNAVTQDGTAQLVTITIHAQNDAAVLSADVRNLTETNAAAAISSSGALTISDPDSAATFVAQAGTDGSYGTFAIDSAGAWTYTASSAHNEFVAGTTHTDTFPVTSADGTPTSVTINILGTNDPAVLSADVRNLTETNAAADISTSGTLTINDPDSPATFVAQAGTAGSFGTFAIDSAGAWTYTASSAHNEFVAGTTHTDTFPVTSADGTPTSVTINILGTNDAAVPDFSSDNKADILWQSNNGTAAAWLMDGTISTSVGPVGPINPGPSWHIKDTGDFNGDLKADILWQHDNGAAALWLMDGTDVTFAGQIGPFNPGPSWEIEGTGDFNGDGKSDILWQHDNGRRRCG